VNRRDNGPQPSYRVTTMVATLAHRHGRHVHAHAHDRPHRHLLRLRRSTPISADNAHREHSHHHRHEHSHGLVDPSISRSRDGVRAVGLSLIALGATAIAQFVVFIATNSIALLADLIHNIGDAATAFPLGAAFLLRSARADAYVSLAVIASAATVGVGLDIADPIIGLAITALILRITWESWSTVRGRGHQH
jgi:Co/Zn/Cd efflux system component